MLRQILRNGQITLPKKALIYFGLGDHDFLDVEYGPSGIHMIPLPVHELSAKEYEKLTEKLDSLKKKKTKGKVYKTTAEARRHLERLSKR